MNQRVLHVMATPHGGSALSTLALIRGLAEHGIPSAVACMAMLRTVDRERRAADEQRITEAVDGRVIFVPLYRWNRRIRARPWQRPLMEAAQIWLTGFTRGTRRRLSTFAREHGTTLVHTGSLVTPDGQAVARDLGLPHVWHVREMVGPGEPFRFFGEGSQFVRRLERYPSSYVATSHSAATRFRVIAPGQSVDVVYNGLDLSDLLALDAPVVRQPVVVGMIANLSARWKRHDLFIHAAAIARRSVDARFVLVGAIDERNAYTRELQRLVDELGLRHDFEFRGRQPTPRAALADIDLLVHVADSESFGRVVVEGMAAGRPVIGVNAGGVGEVIDEGETGLLVPAGDSAGIADAIVQLVEAPDQRRLMGARGRIVAQERFSAKAMTNGMLDIYANARSDHNPSHP